MFTKEQEGKKAGGTIIAQGVKVEGDFASDGDVVIEGEVSGSVKAAGHLEVGPAAKIKAEVSAGSAVIAGELIGNLTVSGKLEMLENSRLDGDLTVEVLSITPGAKLNGRISMDAKKTE